MDPTEENGKHDAVLVQHSPSNTIEWHLEQVLGDDGETRWMLCDSFGVWVLIQHRVEDLQEELQGILVQEVNLGR